MENINFEVVRFEKADKDGMMKTTVKYNGSEKEYTYIRKYWLGKKDGGYLHTVIDGVNITFDMNFLDNTYYVIAYNREYETKGRKRKTTERKNKGINNVAEEKKIIESIKDEVKENKVIIPLILNEDVKHKEYETIRTCIEQNIPIYLAGPAGSGKNYTVEAIAKELGLEFYFTNSVQQEFKLTGFIDAGGKYHETEFYRAFKNGGIFFLDEMDASIPEVLILLNAAIANGYFEFPNGKINANENFRVIAAGNTLGSGADERYNGRMVLDQATLDRFVIIEFNYDINVELNLARGNKELVDFIENLRKINNENSLRFTFSYRAIITVTKLENTTMNLDKILTISVFKGMDKDTLKMFVNNINIENKYTEALRKIA